LNHRGAETVRSLPVEQRVLLFLGLLDFKDIEIKTVKRKT